MPRSLSEPLFERLLRSFPADRAYTRAAWADEAMPEPVAHFLGQLLSHYSRREARHLRRARSDWVNYDHPEVEQAVRTFFNAVEAHTQVPADEWEDTLRQATRHTTAHLVRPVYVLTDFVFGEGKNRVRMPEVLWRMNFFGPYAYLREAVHAFADKKNLDSVGPTRFEQFLHRIDEHITADFDPDRWLRLLDPLFKIARRATGRERVPVVLLQTFFAEKEATAIEQRLEQYGADGHDEVGPTVLYRLIEEAMAEPASPDRAPRPSPDERSPSPDERSPAAPDEGPSAEPEAPDDDIWGVAGAARPEGSGDSEPSQDGDEPTPLWKRFQQGHADPPGSNDGEHEPGAEHSDQPLWAQFRRDRDERLSDAVSDDTTAAESASPAREEPPDEASSPFPAVSSREALEALERDILGTSNPPHRAVYVRQLFNGDQTAYLQVLRRLRTADSWGEASQIIASDIFRAYKVNIYSDAAVHFTNAVESRFREG